MIVNNFPFFQKIDFMYSLSKFEKKHSRKEQGILDLSSGARRNGVPVVFVPSYLLMNARNKKTIEHTEYRSGQWYELRDSSRTKEENKYPG
jgi:sugar/nucleoside kinase (ribokinase family)